MSTYIKLRKAHIPKTTQLGRGFFCSWWVNLGKEAQDNVAISLVRDNLPGNLL